jgi:ribosome-associated toxin RatA of RatAB toxin-antitoxin module
MPTVGVTRAIAAPPDDAWAVVTDVEAYAECMQSVRSVVITDGQGSDERLTTWSVLLRGSVLQWTEVEKLDHARRVVTFEQTDGDLERFSGYWRVEEIAEDRCVVKLHVDFEIGIPLLAEMLNPIAAAALEENSNSMLNALEQRAVSRV